jgi:hypothetical protein
MIHQPFEPTTYSRKFAEHLIAKLLHLFISPLYSDLDLVRGGLTEILVESEGRRINKQINEKQEVIPLQHKVKIKKNH